MTFGQLLILGALGAPAIAAIAAFALGRLPDARDTVSVMAGIALSVVTVLIVHETGEGRAPEWVLGSPLPGVELAFRLEPLGAMFAAMAGVLWTINTLYSIGYMRGLQETNQSRFYICFGVAMVGAMGVAMAANLFTLFIFYEVLTFSTYPLVAHRGDERARKAGRIYVLMLAGASLTLLLPAIIAVQAIAGSTDFMPGGLLAGKVARSTASVLLVMMVFGSAKAALPPMHAWLPNAMVAPVPVSALLHAVAVVKAGVFTILKCAAYIFGPEVLAGAAATQWLIWIAAGAMAAASIVALGKDDIKARLAWSTIGQLAYITAGALLTAGAGLLGGGLHMLTHAFAKVTLFMCAGAIYVATGITDISQMRGLGRRMPIVFVCFLAAAMSVVGLPPFGGMWSKFMLVTAAFGAGQPIVGWAMIASSVLTAAYLLPFGILALLPPEGTPAPAPFIRRRGAPRLAVGALVATTIGAGVLFYFADAIVQFLAPLTGVDR